MAVQARLVQLNRYSSFGATKSPMMTTNLPTFDELRHHLAIPTVNTGCQIQLLGPTGLITDDMEGLHAISDEQGRIKFLSGTEFSMQMYRGQTREYLPCTPTLARLDVAEKQFIALCRHVAFEDAIGAHPIVRFAEQVRFFDAPLFIDREGLAQHYGLATDMLDVTSNFDVAGFFATCSWNPDKRSYEPICNSREPGIIYQFTPVLMLSIASQDEPLGPVRIVGWQPLPRPEQQRAFAVKMKPGQDFSALPSVKVFQFQHDAAISHRIWNAFDQGKALFPVDAASELATQADSLAAFTRAQIERAWQRLENWIGHTFAPQARRRIEENSDITEIDAPCLTWDGLDVEASHEQLVEHFNEIFSRVRYRLTARPAPRIAALQQGGH